MLLIDHSTHDSQCALSLIETARERAEAVGCKVKEVIADTGYDTHQIFRYLGKRGTKTVIKVRRNAVITGNRARGWGSEGDEERQEVGREEYIWQAG